MSRFKALERRCADGTRPYRRGERERIVALTPQGNRIHYAEAANGYWDASRIRNVRVPREGHRSRIRSARAFNEEITAFAP